MKRILAIDDEELVLEIIEDLLAHKGYKVFTTDCPDKAFQIITKNEIDLVLLDVNMPKKNGFAVYRELGALRSLPVLFVTGCTTSFTGASEEFVELWKNQFALGMTDILYKPFSTALLYEKVEALVGESDAVENGQTF